MPKNAFSEPVSLRICKPVTNTMNVRGRLFTCARPGRSLGRTESVPDEVVDLWVRGLPDAEGYQLVSLLGEKEDGRSEYSFYTFGGEHEQSLGKPTFQEWLDTTYGAGRFKVWEYPTLDAGNNALSEEDIQHLRGLVLSLLEQGQTVVLFDSGGSQRTGQFCKNVGFERKPVT